MPSLKIVVAGHVQGVGFRFFVMRLANRLDIEGHVRNLPGGEVEAVAVHPDLAKLVEFQEALWSGPGRVDSVSPTNWEGATRSGFRVVN